MIETSCFDERGHEVIPSFTDQEKLGAIIHCDKCRRDVVIVRITTEKTMKLKKPTERLNMLCPVCERDAGAPENTEEDEKSYRRYFACEDCNVEWVEIFQYVKWEFKKCNED